jgi:hypothetical protein
MGIGLVVVGVTPLAAVAEAMAGQIAANLASAIPDLQVDGHRLIFPTPPSIDIYPPDDAFYEQIGFGLHDPARVFWTVRARVTPADDEAGQDLLLSMIDPRDAASVVQALLDDETLGGLVDSLTVDPPDSYGLWTNPGQTNGLLGCTWRVAVIL